MQITESQLLAIMPKAKAVFDNTGITRAKKFLPYINDTLKEFHIDNRERVCHYLAQIAHESNELQCVEENLNYSAEGLLRTFPSRFNVVTAKSYARNPRKIASKVYGGRYGNGDEASQDGWKYRGRGLIQITFKSNYAAYAAYCGYDVVGKPDLLAQPKGATRSSGWYFFRHGCNELADRDNGSGSMMSAIRKVVMVVRQAPLTGVWIIINEQNE